MDAKQRNKHVIASEAKQSRKINREKMKNNILDCFVAALLAMTNTYKNLISTLFQKQNNLSSKARQHTSADLITLFFIASGLLRADALAMTNKKYPVRDKIFIEISSQAKAACGAAAIFPVICGNPHVMHKGMSFLPIFCPCRDRRYCEEYLKI